MLCKLLSNCTHLPSWTYCFLSLWCCCCNHAIMSFSKSMTFFVVGKEFVSDIWFVWEITCILLIIFPKHHSYLFLSAFNLKGTSASETRLHESLKHLPSWQVMWFQQTALVCYTVSKFGFKTFYNSNDSLLDWFDLVNP